MGSNQSLFLAVGFFPLNNSIDVKQRIFCNTLDEAAQQAAVMRANNPGMETTVCRYSVSVAGAHILGFTPPEFVPEAPGEPMIKANVVGACKVLDFESFRERRGCNLRR